MLSVRGSEATVANCPRRRDRIVQSENEGERQLGGRIRDDSECSIGKGTKAS